MAAVLELPRDLIPSALAYQDELPTIIRDALEECSNQWRSGDTGNAIQCAGQVRTLTKTNSHPVSESVVCVWMADRYREVAQLGPALECCQAATNALYLQPNCEHKDHAEAVIAYLQGLLHHTLGANTGALADYQRALTSFEKAIEHWNSNVARNPTQAGKCIKATQWIKALCGYLTGNLSPVSRESEMQIPAANGQDYELVRLELEILYLLPLKVSINGNKYHMHDLHSGKPFDDNERLKVDWSTHHFAVRVQQNQWAGPYSAKGDYVLVEQRRKVDNPVGYGVLWDDGQQQWKYGTLVYNVTTDRLWFCPYHLIGGPLQDEKVEDQDIGIVRALLKTA